MNNGYVKIIFFVLILLAYVNDKVLTAEYVADNDALAEQTQPKEARVKITLSETDSIEASSSEESISKAPRRKRAKYKKTRPQNIPSETSSLETHLFRTPRPQKTRSKRTRYKATLSKTSPSETTLPEAASSEITLPETVPSETALSETILHEAASSGIPSPEIASSEIVSPEIASSEAALSETTSSEIALPHPVLTNPSSTHIARYTPASFKLYRIYKKSKHLLCRNRAEAKKAREVMDEAVQFLKYYATTKSGYKYHSTSNDGVDVYYRKNGKNTYVEKCQVQISNPNRYDDIIYMLWDPSGARKFDPNFINGKVARSYNRDLLMVLKLYRNEMLSSERYFYALAKKVHISEDTTIIVMSSGNINDHNPASTKTFKNKIVESMNSFKTDVKLSHDIRDGYYKKTFVNLSGYLIKKKDDHVDVTFVNSINFNAFIPLRWAIKSANIEAMKSIIYLKYYFNN
ncbi:fam-a protein [Plasmodium chabaudi adami]|uniref:Fam-a protein n=1 Tax=Plasmodium chabaudi adami TaxID=5826 RepID=A0A1D3L850_PLACE|nr:fam-a protein [Plasmodium chabaudi adami]